MWNFASCENWVSLRDWKIHPEWQDVENSGMLKIAGWFEITNINCANNLFKIKKVWNNDFLGSVKSSRL